MILKHPTIPNYTKDVPDSPKRIAKSWKSTGWLPVDEPRGKSKKKPETTGHSSGPHLHFTPEPDDTE